MNQKIIGALLVLALLSGCSQLAGASKDAERLQSIELRYLGRGTIAPDSIQEIDLMKQELSRLQAKSASSVQEMIDIRISLLDFTRHYLEGEKSRIKISPLLGGCGTNDPLQTTIGHYAAALALQPEIVQKIEAFEAKNPGSRETTNISLRDFEDFAFTIKNTHDDMVNFYNQACAPPTGK